MASGDTLVVFTPLEATFPVSNFPGLDLRNFHPVLDFDGVTDEEVYFEGHLPAHYAGSGITIDLYVTFTSAVAGNSRWQTDVERQNTDMDADSFSGTFQSGGGVPNATSGIQTKVSIIHSNSALDGLLANEPFRLKVRRDADGTSGTDDVTTDAELWRVVLRET